MFRARGGGLPRLAVSLRPCDHFRQWVRDAKEQTMTADPEIGEPRIVVGVDGSRQSQQALLWAAHFATIFGAGLDVVTCWEYPASYGWAAIAPEWSPSQDMEKVLDDTVRAVFGDQPPQGMQLQVLEGGAARVLLDACRGAVMLVVGSRGHGGFAGLLLGSVSASVAEHSSCPVFIVHGDQAPPPARPV
jgi:nucleotide-binding universal stress UspA family protein